jgi:hypothetical protein
MRGHAALALVEGSHLAWKKQVANAARQVAAVNATLSANNAPQVSNQVAKTVQNAGKVSASEVPLVKNNVAA